MEVKISKDWKEFLKEEFEKDYFINLTNFIKEEYIKYSIWPRGANIFKAFDLCPLNKLKVVIIGQDPYHTKGVANGLAFSANNGKAIPPSLLNIYKEIRNEYNKKIPDSPDLSKWAKNGVLLLNATLTVREGIAGSHQGKGWEEFSDNVIKKLSDNKRNLVFILWGAFANKKKIFINETKHLILTSPHPSPFSADRGFFGNNHFKKTNEYLKNNNKKEINW